MVLSSCVAWSLMRVDELALGRFSRRKDRFEGQIFQRPYVWNKTRAAFPFGKRFATCCPQNTPCEPPFMRAIVLEQQRTVMPKSSASDLRRKAEAYNPAARSCRYSGPRGGCPTAQARCRILEIGRERSRLTSSTVTLSEPLNSRNFRQRSYISSSGPPSTLVSLNCAGGCQPRSVISPTTRSLPAQLFDLDASERRERAETFYDFSTSELLTQVDFDF